MSPPSDDELNMMRHALNNLLGKILGAAELALDHARELQLRTELETIIGLSEEGAGIVARLGPSASQD
ncbi:hypothetical protein [uncultured Phenylobacterium sp.]|uniref:hypothetical protein n=1 Tax=uncultured Phenylobacterium sp. TaxID=349273 RepID=UPI0025F1ACB0|nr:hypothetical protein [uncultured Phenylobacterium sp.]